MVKQKEIAKKLNLSVMTVSKALRNHPDLAEATKNQVIKKALEMGYTDIPALAAKRCPLGIIIYQSSREQHAPLLESEIRRRIFEAVQRACRRRNIETVVEFAEPSEVPLFIRNHTVKGVMVLGRYTSETVANLQGISAIAVSNFTSTTILPRITADNQGGARLVTQNLIKQGHKSILFLGLEESGSELHRERSEGYCLEMLQHGLTPHLKFLARDRMEEALKEVSNYTAVACSSDSTAHALLTLLRANGKRVPEDCSVTGFDNLLSSESCGLTTYAPDWVLMGELAVQLIFSSDPQINGKNVHVVIPGELIVRSSTQPLVRR